MKTLAGTDASASRVPAEERVFSLVLALVASPQGMSKAELLSSVYGYVDRKRSRDIDANIERQFERDKEQLRRLGVPLETIDPPLDTGDNKLTRYRISKDRLQLPSEVRFTAEELSLLRLAALAWSDGSLGSESRWANMKLAALGAGIDVRNLGISLRLGIPEPAAPILQRAIDERRTVRFDYQLPERDAPLQRVVAPLRLHRAEGRWHLIAHDLERGAVRVFLLSRIASPVRLDSEGFDTALFGEVSGAIARLRALQESQVARIRVRKGSRAEAHLEPRAASRDTVASQADTRVFELGTIDLHMLAAELVGYGDEVEVLEPESLRDSVISALRMIRERHSARDRHSVAADRPGGSDALKDVEERAGG